MRNLPFSRLERALLGALLAFLAANYGLRFALAPREPFSVIRAFAEATADLPSESTPPPPEAPATSISFDLLAFINEAPPERLTELPGIGPVLAGRIVAYREQAGPFRRVEEITEVQGIGPARLEELLAFAQGRSSQ